MKLFLFFILGFSWTQSYASSWEECYFTLQVTKVDAEEILVSGVKYTGGTGMAGSPGRGNCLAHLKKGKIPVEQIAEGKELAKKGASLVVHRRSYSAMGPAGAVSGITWKLKNHK